MVRNRLVLAFVAGVFACVASPLAAMAQTAGDAVAAPSEDVAPAAAPASPCMGWQYRVFDFWVGDWDVFDHEGNYAGRNLISVEENGCLLLERWVSVSGGTGQSYNYYDPANDSWRQVWLSQSVIIDYEGGYAEDGGMALDGEITYRDGTVRPFRGRWTPNRNGTLTQVFEQFDPAAETWAPWFIGIYRRVEDNPDEEPAGAAEDETGE